MTDRRADNGKAPRETGRKEQVDQLLDGTRTAAEIALIMGVASEYVRATCARQGWQHRLSRRSGTGVAVARAPVILRDAGPSRAEGERLLGWIADRVAGKAIHDIARRDRQGVSFVQTATNAVRDADLAESGEPALQVGRAYLWRRK